MPTVAPATTRPTRPESRSRHRRTASVLAAALTFTALAACEPTSPDPTTTTTAPPTTAAAAPVPAGAGSLWISRAELAQLPTSGPAWQRLDAGARGSWGTASLSDNNATHDTSTLAGALVSARTGDAALTAKTRTAIMSVTKITSYNRVLELSRNITSYVIAADLVGLAPADEATFRSFVSGLRTKPLSGHSGGKNLLETALRSPNNWGAMARAAMSAIDLYLGDRTQLALVADAHRAWLGETVANQLTYSSTAWHAAGAKAGINRRGATILGRNVDGVLPEDQRRTGEPSSAAPAKGSYPWEALQGALVTGVLLDRSGVVDINAGDAALVRAFTWLTTTNANPASSDDTWQPWVLDRVAGARIPTTPATSPGKNMAWSDWTHGPRA